MITPRALIVRAPAKINRTLRILGRRPDGYHELETIFQAIDLHDTLTFVASRGPLRIASHDSRLPIDRTNLIWRAGEALWHHARRKGDPHGVTVHVEKRIPIGGGLGGGSSNAAAALAGFCRVWNLKLEKTRLLRIAATLGADVPFFMVGGAAVGRARGDQVTSVRDKTARWVVLLVPAFSISTAEAYGWYAHDRERESAALSTSTVNDLEEPVARRHPEIRQMISALVGAGAEPAALSGSGSTVFGLFTSRRAAEAARARMQASGWSSVLAKTLTREQYRRLVRPQRVGLPGRPAT
jgi:4-diphosphocytidyl-2-C-methyl-D-erythritol kinase